MNADQIAEIRPALIEAIQGPPNLCLTLEVTGDSTKWVQVTDQTVNAAYPHENPPDEIVKGLPTVSDFELLDWEAGTYVTLEFVSMEAALLAQWIDLYFVRVLGCKPGGYHLDIKFENL